MKKRLIAVLTLLVLVLSLSVTAMAAEKPTATLTKAPAIVRLGKTATFTFKLDSKDYAAEDGVFRAKLISKISKGSEVAGNAVWAWTGAQTYKLRAQIKKTAPTGNYKLSYTTYYRADESSSWKKAGKTRTQIFKVR